MKVLMFGWEFPPHISGGLGTACFGLTKGLSELKNVEVIFVVPKAFGDEDQTNIKLIGANQIPIKQSEIQFSENQSALNYIEVNSEIIPTVGEQEFWKQKNKK